MKDAMDLSQVPVTVQAKRVLALSKGRVRVPLEDLGPALFNRQGQPTCGRHCWRLAERVVKVEGFATFRYEAGFCHEPDPKNPLAVSAHGNRMADRDSQLPRLPGMALKGVFAKTHLVTMLQLYKAGRMPDLVRFVASSQALAGQASGQSDMGSAHAELEDVLKYGIYMHVFPYEAVTSHRAEMISLMASDNFDHGHGLTDSELRCIKGVREAILNLEVPPGQCQFDVVRSHVQRLAGQRWHERDLDAFWEFAKTTLDVHLDLLMEVWTFAECEDVLKVDSAFFAALAKMPAKLQWSRSAVAVCQFLSDRDSECALVGGRHVAGAVDKGPLKRLGATNRSDTQKASSQDVEDFSCSP